VLLTGTFFVGVVDSGKRTRGLKDQFSCRFAPENVVFCNYLESFPCIVLIFSLNNLKARLVQSGTIDERFDLNIDALKLLLNQRFESVDYAQAKEDVFPFVRDKRKLDLWSKEFFIDITKKLEAL